MNKDELKTALMKRTPRGSASWIKKPGFLSSGRGSGLSNDSLVEKASGGERKTRFLDSDLISWAKEDPVSGRRSDLLAEGRNRFLDAKEKNNEGSHLG